MHMVIDTVICEYAMRRTFKEFLAEVSDIQGTTIFDTIVARLYEYLDSLAKAQELKSRTEWFPKILRPSEVAEEMSVEELGGLIEKATEQMPWRIKGTFLDLYKTDPEAAKLALINKVKELQVGRAPGQPPKAPLAQPPKQAKGMPSLARPHSRPVKPVQVPATGMPALAQPPKRATGMPALAQPPKRLI